MTHQGLLFDEYPDTVHVRGVRYVYTKLIETTKKDVVSITVKQCLGFLKLL